MESVAADLVQPSEAHAVTDLMVILNYPFFYGLLPWIVLYHYAKE